MSGRGNGNGDGNGNGSEGDVDADASADPDPDDPATDVEADATAWEATVAEMDALASERAAAGWETVTLRAADTTPEPPDVGDSDRFGLVYTVPDDVADEFRAAFEAGTFDRFTVHSRRVGDAQFLVTAVADPDAEVAVFLAGAFDRSAAEALERAARDAGAMYSHVQLLDWTHLGSFRHDDPGAFFGAAGE